MRSQLFQKTPKAARHPTRMLKPLLSLLTEDSPAMNARMDVAAIRRFNGIKNTPAQCGAVVLSVAQSGRLVSSAHHTHRGAHALTEAVKREVAGRKLVLHEGALADLGQHRGGG